jgi:hypothetical protein
VGDDLDLTGVDIRLEDTQGAFGFLARDIDALGAADDRPVSLLGVPQRLFGLDLTHEVIVSRRPIIDVWRRDHVIVRDDRNVGVALDAIHDLFPRVDVHRNQDQRLDALGQHRIYLRVLRGNVLIRSLG